MKRRKKRGEKNWKLNMSSSDTIQVLSPDTLSHCVYKFCSSTWRIAFRLTWWRPLMSHASLILYVGISSPDEPHWSESSRQSASSVGNDSVRGFPHHSICFKLTFSCPLSMRKSIIIFFFRRSLIFESY